MPLPSETLRRRIETAAAAQRVSDIASADQLLELFACPTLLGTPLQPDIAKFIGLYVEAELAGGEQKDKFIQEVYGKISDREVERPLVEGKDLTLADLVSMTRYAVTSGKWSLGRKRNPGEFDKLPLAA